MKKLLGFALLSLIIFSFSGCSLFEGGQGTKDVDTEEAQQLQKLRDKIEGRNAEEDGETPNKIKEDEIIDEKTEEETEVEEVSSEEKDEPKIVEESISLSLTENKLSVTSPQKINTISTGELEIKGSISENAEKIIVDAKGGSDIGGYYTDRDYQLKNFKPGDKTFTYKAKPEFNNMAVGENTYVISAYFDDGTVETEVVKVNYYSGGSYFKINSPVSGQTLTEEPIIFSGTISPNALYITVYATGGTDDSTKYVDDYKLENYNNGDDVWTYRAKRGWNNLAIGMNTYKFVAHFDDGTTNTEILYATFEPKN